MPQTKKWMPAGLLAIASLLLFLTSPHRGDFWWSDAPRHALDGVFFRDLIHALPLSLSGLRHYTMDYYLHYPAITGTSYPPLFPLIETLFLQVLGVSHTSAQLCVATFVFAAACGVYALASRWLGRWHAFAAGLLFIGLHEIALWGRQTMLDVPCCAFLLWSAYALLRFTETRRIGFFYAFLVLYGCSLYTKQTAVFAVPIFALILLREVGWKILLERRVWINLVVFGLAMAPLAFVTFRFGPANVENVVGGSWASERWSLPAWGFYLQSLPSQVGWVVLLCTGAYVLMALLKPDWRLRGTANLILIAWFVFGYIFFSLIALREPRHSLLILLPFAILPIALIARIVPVRWSGLAACAFAGVCFGRTLMVDKVPQVSGYREAVEYLVENAEPNSIIVFSGNRDGSFIFNTRVMEPRKSFSVLRSDKLLTKVTVKRELGLQEFTLSESEISTMLKDLGVSYVVLEPSFWADLAVMQKLEAVLHTGEYRLATVIPVHGGSPGEKELQIYRATARVPQGRKEVHLQLGIGNFKLSGCIGVPLDGCR